LSGQSFETNHVDQIHDAQLDFFGKRLATASSDRTIQIFDIVGDKQVQTALLQGHDGPVWQVAWAHPKFGSHLASCSYDGKVILWTERSANVWEPKAIDQRASSVNAISFAPESFGLLSLAAGSADGYVSVYALVNGQWGTSASFYAHPNGCNAVSWGPDAKSGAILQGQQDSKMGQAPSTKRLVTGGSDNCVKIWRNDVKEQQDRWIDVKAFENGDNRHRDWVRDVAWAPSIGRPSSTIASCSADKTVLIWKETSNGVWKKTMLGGKPFQHIVWRVSWSLMGNILAVSQGNNQVSLWKEGLEGNWQNLSSLAQ
jgi:protein transport protein SEC13